MPIRKDGRIHSRRGVGRLIDVAVVGAGNAALCAAIAAAERGSTVTVIERAPNAKRGGNSWFTDGAIRFAHGGLKDVRPIIPSMTDQVARTIDLTPYTAEQYYDDLHSVSGGRVDPILGRTLVDRSLSTVRWMHDLGVPFSMIYDNQAFEVDGRFRFWGGLHVRIEERGVGLVRALFERVGLLGITVRYQTKLDSITHRNPGFVLNVETEGRLDQIEASQVILACGGFEANQEARAQHLGDPWRGAIVRGTEFNTGDGLRIALELGAVRHGDWTSCHAVATDANAPEVGDFTKPGDIFKKHSCPLGIIVNRDCERFVNEGEDFRNYTYARYGREVLKQPGQIAYQIFDAKVADRLRSEYHGPDATRIEAETLETLAEKIQLDGARLRASVSAYNAAVQEGSFNPEVLDGKRTRGIVPPKTNWAQRIEDPPFLAFPVRCGITFTFGGIRVNEKAQILMPDGTPIKGLFAAGEMVGGLFYGNYPGGSGLMSGAVFGRIAGSQAIS